MFSHCNVNIRPKRLLYQNMLPWAYNGRFVGITLNLTSILTSMTLEMRSRSNLIVSSGKGVQVQFLF